MDLYWREQARTAAVAVSRRSPARRRCSRTGCRRPSPPSCPWPVEPELDSSTRLQAFSTTAITFLEPTRVSPPGPPAPPPPSSAEEEPRGKPVPPERAEPAGGTARPPRRCPGPDRFLRRAPSGSCRLRTSSASHERLTSLSRPEKPPIPTTLAPRAMIALGRARLARDGERPAAVGVDVGQGRVQRSGVAAEGAAAEAAAAAGAAGEAATAGARRRAPDRGRPEPVPPEEPNSARAARRARAGRARARARGARARARGAEQRRAAPRRRRRSRRRKPAAARAEALAFGLGRRRGRRRGRSSWWRRRGCRTPTPRARASSAAIATRQRDRACPRRAREREHGDREHAEADQHRRQPVQLGRIMAADHELDDHARGDRDRRQHPQAQAPAEQLARAGPDEGRQERRQQGDVVGVEDPAREAEQHSAREEGAAHGDQPPGPRVPAAQARGDDHRDRRHECEPEQPADLAAEGRVRAAAAAPSLRRTCCSGLRPARRRGLRPARPRDRGRCIRRSARGRGCRSCPRSRAGSSPG